MNLERTALIIIGMRRDFLDVHSTLREAIGRGSECELVADACASAYPQLHDAALLMVEIEGGIFGSIADKQGVLAELENPQTEAIS